jgi:hypothetical protein
LEEWLSLLEGYFCVQKFTNSKRITSALHKSILHVRYWRETYYEKIFGDESAIFGTRPTSEYFFYSLKEKYYLVGNYDDQYMRWKTLHWKRD